METLFELILQFLGEMLIQGVVELGFRSLADVFSNQRHPVLSTIGSLLWGAIAGGLSLWLFPRSFIANDTLKLLNLLISPIMLGFLMARLGKARAKKRQPVRQLDRFGYAFAFALAMAFVRFRWAK